MHHPHIAEKIKALSELLIIVGVCMLGLFVFSAAGLLLAIPITGASFDKLSTIATQPQNIPNARLGLLVMQAVTAFGSFVVAPWVYIKAKQANFEWNRFNNNTIQSFRVVLAIGIFMMPALAYIVEWNENWSFPTYLATFEQWAKAKEEELKMLTKFLSSFDGWGEFAVGFLVISIMAGFTEEFFFRGILQPRLIIFFGNEHAGIWAAGLIFSIIHLQFYGLVPRMLLGVLFGYYYYWSGNLWLAIFGHSLNNGLSVIAMYLNHTGTVDVDLDSTSQIPWFTAVFSALAVGVLLYQLKRQLQPFHQKLQDKNPREHEVEKGI
jgi:membrane protease YdiL (CAAX protease family)